MNPQKITAGPLPYLLYTPEADPRARAPLILFLHGSGERGNDLAHVGDEGLTGILANLPEAATVVVPQCPEDTRWTDHLEVLEAILDEVVAGYPVDEDRLYLTGLSLGGQGAWFLGARAPERFAALVPICGRSNPEAAERLKGLPTWVFHGADDEVVPLNESEKMAQALRAVGAEVRLSVLPDTGHDSWTRTYENPDLYRWLFAQRRAG
jgi:predicted peptidase